MKQNEQGGRKAACMLNDVVEKYLFPVDSPGRTIPRIIIRVYADTKRLTQILGTLTGGFAAGFTRSMPFADFTDSLDVDGTRFKLTGKSQDCSIWVNRTLKVHEESLRFAINDSHCAHILYAACHDTDYLKHLASCLNLPRKNKVTLVQGSGFKSDFYKLGLSLTQFSTIFRWTKQPSAPTHTQICILSDNVPMHQRRDDWRNSASPARNNGAGVSVNGTNGTDGTQSSEYIDPSKILYHFFAKVRIIVVFSLPFILH